MIRPARLRDAGRVAELVLSTDEDAVRSWTGGDRGAALRMLRMAAVARGGVCSPSVTTVEDVAGAGVRGACVAFPVDQARRRMLVTLGCGLAVAPQHAAPLYAAAWAMLPDGGPGAWLLDSLAVHEDWRGQGIARGLIGRVRRRARHWGAQRMIVWVAAENGPARALYRSVGFRGVGVKGHNIEMVLGV